MTSTETEQISGKVSQIYKATPDWTAGRLRVKSRDVSFTVKGYVTLGEPVTLRGHWTTHTKYGKQFNADEVVYTLPVDIEGLRSWLIWYVPAIGPVKSTRLVDEFGMQLLDLATSDPQQVAIFAEIPIESVNLIANQWAEFGAKVAALSALSQFGMTKHQSEQVYARFKGSAITIIKEDPYLLLREVHGLGWKTIDELARKMGFPTNHPGRLRAAVIQAVATEYESGSTVVEKGLAIDQAADLTELPEKEYGGIFAEQIQEAGGNHSLRIVGLESQWLSLPHAHAHESYIWERLANSRDNNPHLNESDEKLRDLAEDYAKFSTGRDQVYELDADQVNAIYLATRHRFVFVTGGAGSGKTLVARAITKLFKDAGREVYLCAPTGKAARRLTEVIGREASTIHRLLGYNPLGGFLINQHTTLIPGVVIVDEASLIDSELWYHLLRGCGDNVSIVAIGDPNQLPPVGAGSMLRDVIQLDLAPVAKLGHCHRQAGALKVNCNALLDGSIEPSIDGDPSPWMVHRNLVDPNHITRAVMKLFEEYLPNWGYDPVTGTQFLTAMHKGQLGTTHLNKVCQWLHQKRLGNDLGEPKFGDDSRVLLHPGDKVMHIKNNYNLNVMNGTQGVVIDTHPSLIVDYDGRAVVYPSEFRGEVQLAYVITPHKAQGSEWPCAVVISPKQHSFMQTRSWIYTAATRAKQTCVIIGDEDGVRRAAERVEVDRRTTLLQVFAKNEEARP